MNPSPEATDAEQETPFVLLLVDDEQNILNSLRRLFRPKGYRCLTANSGHEGLEILERESVDLIISDMRMPEMTGAEFLSHARERWPQVVRILLTGYADMTSTVDAINKGQIWRYLSKPWDDNDVLATVAEALEYVALVRDKVRLEALTQRQNEELKSLNTELEDKVLARTAELAEANEKLKNSFLQSVRLFANLLDMRGGVLAGHSRRVADLARRVGKRLGISGDEERDLFFAALLHDIGTLTWKDQLLTKPFVQLTPDERSEYNKHPARGAAVLMGVPQFSGAAALVRAHHERFDGEGFPDRLAGLTIPFGARVLNLCVDFDAVQIGSIRPNRASREEAMEYIRAGRGKRYDPQVVDAFLEEMVPVAGKVEIAVRGPVLQIPTQDLRPGMALAEDLTARDGSFLLAQDFILDEHLIIQIRNYERAEGTKLKISILGRTV